MANRSKKVVISARIEPFLKAALDTAAALMNEKIVKVLEGVIMDGLQEIAVPSPFRGEGWDESEANFLVICEAIWTEDEVLFKLRAGAIGPGFTGEALAAQAKFIIGSDYFKGDYDLFGDLNGLKKGGAICDTHLINLELIKQEWPIIESYTEFLRTNKNLAPSYESFKEMLKSSKPI